MNVFSGMLLFFAACKCCCFNVALEPKSAWSHKAYQKCHRNCSETSRNISQIGYIPCLTREKLVQLVGTCKTSSCGSACRSGLLPQCHGAAWRCMRCMHCMPRVQRCPGGPVVPRTQRAAHPAGQLSCTLSEAVEFQPWSWRAGHNCENHWCGISQLVLAMVYRKIDMSTCPWFTLGIQPIFSAYFEWHVTWHNHLGMTCDMLDMLKWNQLLDLDQTWTKHARRTRQQQPWPSLPFVERKTIITHL